jgi:DNA-directed RNA polymerase subunit RPC12/RpoP
MPFDRNLEPSEYDCPTCGRTAELDTQSMQYFCRDCGEKIPEQNLVGE